MTLWKIAARAPRKTSRSPKLRHDQRKPSMHPRPAPGDFYCPDQTSRGGRRGRDQSAEGTGAACRLADIALEPDPAAGDAAAAHRDRSGARSRESAPPASPAYRRRATATAPCITIGPASVSGMTKWTVAPDIFTPARSAWPCGIEAGKRRQQRGMNVEHPAIPALHEFGGEQPHEPAEADQVDPVLVQRRLQNRLERRTILAERLAFDGDGSGRRLPWLSQDRRRRPGWKSRPRSRPGNLQPCSLDQRGHVRSAPGNQDGDAALHGSLTMPDRDDRYRPRDARPRPGSPRRAARRSRRLA